MADGGHRAPLLPTLPIPAAPVAVAVLPTHPLTTEPAAVAELLARAPHEAAYRNASIGTGKL